MTIKGRADSRREDQAVILPESSGEQPIIGLTVQMLMERLKAGASFGDLAADFSEDPQTAQRGGDLGFIPVSALQKQAPLLRDAVLKAQPGTVNHVNLGGGHEDAEEPACPVAAAASCPGAR